ncbi:MAG TPA: PepSY domain-containing protein [Planctomycetaceae bacterium]|nr:PepSY domain-containing protein [Planctomycetaceae bacterium]
MSESVAPTAGKSWPDYRAVWRWHFYAGLFCIPFVVILSMSGAVYLFKPQIEAWVDEPYDHLAITRKPASAAEQVGAALAAVPDSTLDAYELPRSPNHAARVIVNRQGDAIRVYVHPQTLEVLHAVPENERLMRLFFRIHGELLMGDRGSMLVELAASWTIIMIITGLFLWWPRQAKGLGGLAYPRLGSGSRIFWRDLHSVTGVWISCLALFLLLSGLPWAKSWGNYFKAARRVIGAAVAQQDWTTGSDRASGKSKSISGGHGEHGGGSGRRNGRPRAPTPKDLTPLDRIAAMIRPLELLPPVLIAPPARDSANWTAKSMTQNRPQRVNLVVDGTTGTIVSREDFGDRHLIDRIVGTCVAAHEGQLFGWPNQLLGLVTAGGLLLMCVSGVTLWWRRREQGVLGAPRVALSPRVSIGLIVLVVMLGIYLPMFGGSLLVVLTAEKSILSRIPSVRHWLGLNDRGADEGM